jgi:CBS domain-containing protein
MTMLTIERPQSSEYAPFFAHYIEKVTGDDLYAALQATHRQTQELVGSLTDTQLAFRYAEGKWNVKEIIGHLIDAERIFAYRALRIARADSTDMAGFNENTYVAASNADERSIGELLSEFAVVRAASLALFRSFTPAMFERVGTVSGKAISVRALAYITAGHEIHHLAIIRERYLQG